MSSRAVSTRQRTRRAVGADLRVAVRGAVAGDVERHAEEAEPLGGPATNLGRVLADAAGEDERIEAAERRGHRGDSGAQPVHVDLERQPRGRLTRSVTLDDLAHVGAAGQTLEARPMLERLGELARRKALVLEQPEQHARGRRCPSGSPSPGPRAA